MSASDLFHVCIHESAHMTLARHYGSEGWGIVHPDPHREGMFNGCAYHDPIKSRVHRRMVGLAGIVAEEMYANAKFDVARLADQLLEGAIELSDSDADQAGRFTRVHVAQCAMLVKELWPEIERYAHRLMDESLNDAQIERSRAGRNPA